MRRRRFAGALTSIVVVGLAFRVAYVLIFTQHENNKIYDSFWYGVTANELRQGHFFALPFTGPHGRPSAAHVDTRRLGQFPHRPACRDHVPAPGHGGARCRRRPLRRPAGPLRRRSLGRADGGRPRCPGPQLLDPERRHHVGDPGHALHGLDPPRRRPSPSISHPDHGGVAGCGLRRRSARASGAAALRTLPLGPGDSGGPHRAPPPEVRAIGYGPVGHGAGPGPLGGAEPGRVHRPDVHLNGDWLALLGANCPQTYNGPQLGSWSLACSSSAPTHGDESVQAAHAQHVAVQYAEHHTGRIPVVVLARVGRLWDFYEPIQMADVDVNEGRPVQASLAGLGFYYALLPLGIAGIVIYRRRRIRQWFLVVPAAVLSLVAAVVYGSVRFRAPFEVCLVVLAAPPLVVVGQALGHRMADHRARRRGRRDGRQGGAHAHARRAPRTHPLADDRGVSTPEVSAPTKGRAP